MAEGNAVNRPSLTWISHPFVERPRTSAVLIGFIVGLLIVIKVSFEAWFWVIFSVVVLFISLARYFFPTRYELTEDAVTMKLLMVKQSRPWSYFRTFYKSARGVVLSPFLRPSRLDTYRGFHLLCYQNRDEVIEFVSTKLKQV